jgi:DNA-directed RNA polymerase specialized sigma24 family protein
MILARKNIKARSFNPNLNFELPEPLKPEILKIKLDALRKGDMEAGREIFNTHLRLGMQIVGKYLATVKEAEQHLEDLVSVVLETFQECIVGIATEGRCPHDNVTGYLVKTLHGKIEQYLLHAKIVYVPLCAIRDGQPTKSQSHLKNNLEAKQSDYGELLEIITNCAETERQHLILKLKMKGLNLREIADILQVSISLVHLELTTIRKNYEQQIARMGA